MENIAPRGGPVPKSTSTIPSGQRETPLQERVSTAHQPEPEDSDSDSDSSDEEDEIPANYTYSPNMQELASSHPLMKAWYAFHREFLAIVDAQFPRETVAACPAALPPSQRYYSDEQRAVFIVYLSYEDIRCRFDQDVHSDIRAWLNRHVPPTDGHEIPIRFYALNIRQHGSEGTTKLFKYEETMPGPQVSWKIHDHGTSRPGHSVSAKGSTTNGTIFGFVTLTNQEDGGNVPGIYAILCHHVVTNHVETKSLIAGDALLRPLQSPSFSDNYTTIRAAAFETDVACVELSKQRAILDESDSKQVSFSLS